MSDRPDRRARPLRRADFARVTRCGRRVSTRYFLVFLDRRDDDGPPRLGITVTRKVGTAVRRNRIKRLVREWFRLRRAMLGALDVVVIAKREAPTTLGLASTTGDLDRSLEWSPP
jgi:ribonuclease P protein component